MMSGQQHQRADEFRGAPRQRQQPMAQSVPRTTAMAVEATAIQSDCQIALVHAWARQEARVVRRDSVS
jgi:hypothetical protein